MEQSTTPGLLALLGLTTAVPAVLFAVGLLAHAIHALTTRQPAKGPR